MSIQINVPPFLEPFTGGLKRVDVSGNTVGECLEGLATLYPGVREKLFTRDGQLPKGLNIFINGEDAYPGVMNEPVNEGDTIHIAYLIFGG